MLFLINTCKLKLFLLLLSIRQVEVKNLFTPFVINNQLFGKPKKSHKMQRMISMQNKFKLLGQVREY